MQLPTIPKIGRLSKKHKITAAGAAAAAAVVLAVTGLQVTGGTAQAKGEPTGFAVDKGQQVKDLDAQAGLASQKAIREDAAAKQKAADAVVAQQKAAADAAAKKKAADAAADAAKKKAAAEAAARAEKERAANRSTHRTAVEAAPKKAAKKVTPKAAPKAVVKKKITSKITPKVATSVAPKKVVYPDNLDGWIREARAVLAAHDIPVPTYNGIYRNIMRESSGNPYAINLWDINAQNGIPSKGLLQTIDPTFNAYHVSGTSWNVYNPVANIAAACNYAWHVYGGMDNVNSAY